MGNKFLSPYLTDKWKRNCSLINPTAWPRPRAVGEHSWEMRPQALWALSRRALTPCSPGTGPAEAPPFCYCTSREGRPRSAAHFSRPWQPPPRAWQRLFAEEPGGEGFQERSGPWRTPRGCCSRQRCLRYSVCCHDYPPCALQWLTVLSVASTLRSPRCLHENKK